MAIPYDVLKRDYELVRIDHPDAKLKPYDELTDEERARHEAIYRDTAGFFQELGDAISNGTPLPNPLNRK
jgi:hypothetical protein